MLSYIAYTEWVSNCFVYEYIYRQVLKYCTLVNVSENIISTYRYILINNSKMLKS